MTEEHLIYIALTGLGGVATGTEIATSHSVTAWATAGLLMLVGGSAGLVRSWLQRPRLPKAWIRR